MSVARGAAVASRLSAQSGRSPLGRSVLGRASWTFSLRPSSSLPFQAGIAFDASTSIVISTKLKPRNRL